MNTKSEQMGFPPEGETAPFQGTTSEEREAFESYARLEADPSDPMAGDEPTYITRAHQK